MDYVDEQQNELEALKSIFFDEFEEIEEGPPAKFKLLVRPDESSFLTAEESESQYHLIVTYTDKYPEEIPLLEISDAVNLNAKEVEDLSEKVMASAEEQLGMAMVFGVHSAAKEHLEEMLRLRIARREQLEEEKRIAEEEAERARYAGTKVTTESFQAWKEGFLKELRETEKLTAAPTSVKSKADNMKGRFTGRQLFEKDKSLAKSDVGLLQEGDVTVEFDKELFSGDFEGLEDDEEENAVLAGFREDDD
ncbi:RWD domain-containing protein 1 [Phlyctochytrium planicorne]|nr:RWD domain-containing protein 1 [Phlyctochytrium planicorne]